jgi:capsular exopolysaccharide synthesis family protein
MATDLSSDSSGGMLAQIQHYLHILLKWKWLIGAVVFTCVAAAAAYSLMLPPVYTASGSVWIEDDPKVLPFEQVQSFGQGTTLSSHARLLQSRTLAADVIEKLKLYENPAFAGKIRKGAKNPDPGDPQFREALVQAFLSNLVVASAERTRLVDVRFSCRDPKLAADTLNALFDGYVDMIVRKRYAASEQATEFLNTQIASLRTEIEAKEKELNKYGSEKDILPLTAAEAQPVSQISDVSKALTAATIDRINKLNIYAQLKSAPLGELPDAPTDSLIGRLREQYVTLSRDYTTRLATVRPEYPEMQRIKAALDTARDALQNETENLTRKAYTEYQTALGKEQSLKELLDRQKNAAYTANSNSVLYYSLRSELEDKKTLLKALSKRQSETDISTQLKGLEALNVWIVDKADYPLRPTSPNKRKNVLMALLGGLAGGVGIALGLEFLNHTVKTSKDVMATVGIPTLGTIPAFEAGSNSKGPLAELKNLVSILKGPGGKEQENGRSRSKRRDRKRLRKRARNGLMGSLVSPASPRDRIELIVQGEPQSIQAESYRTLRTTLLVSSPPSRIKTIIFTSPLAMEGKSSTVSNLGFALAEASRRVVIVDSDLRKPRQGEIFGIGNRAGPGLSKYLITDIDPADILQPVPHSTLQLITSGPLPDNPIELLTSDRMDILVAYLKRSFDYVLFDTPPLLAVSDALALAPMADSIVLVARAGHTPIPALKQAKLKLDAHKLKCLGVILNGVDLVEQDGYYARQYYHYSKAD